MPSLSSSVFCAVRVCCVLPSTSGPIMPYAKSTKLDFASFLSVFSEKTSKKKEPRTEVVSVRGKVVDCCSELKESCTEL